MWNKLNNERGLLLPDLVASLPLGVIVLAVMTFSVINFLVAYGDIRDFTQCQDELFQAVETIRYGYVQEGVVNSRSLCGMMSANMVTSSSQNNLRMEVDGDPATQILSEYKIDGSGQLTLRGRYGSQLFYISGSTGNDIKLFPTSDRRIDGVLKYRIINPGSAFTPIKVDEGDAGTNYIRLLGVNLEAQVRFRERENGQTTEEDARMNTRTIRYETKIFVPNVPSALG